jgi:hypothetical protein
MPNVNLGLLVIGVAFLILVGILRRLLQFWFPFRDAEKNRRTVV